MTNKLSEVNKEHKPILNKKIELDDINYMYPETKAPAIEGFNLTLKSNNIIAIVGPSGCGKSTLLKIIAGLITPDSGSIVFSHKGNQTIGYAPQSPTLMPWLDLRKNMTFLTDIRQEKVSDEDYNNLFTSIGLKDHKDIKPSELSGGMQTRLSIARALAGSPDVLLLDEPFSNLDEITAEKLITSLSTYFEDKKPALLFISHNVAQAVMLADTVVVVSGPPLRIIKRVDTKSCNVGSQNPDQAHISKVISSIRKTLKDN